MSKQVIYTKYLLTLLTCCICWILQANPNNIKWADNPPTVQDIPDQTIGLGGQFTGFDLNSFLIEQDGDSVYWSYNFNTPISTNPLPVWEVEASDFQFSMNVTAIVHSRGAKAEGAEHLLAAFVDDELRGLTQAIQVGNNWMFFLTLFSDTNGEEIEFKFYDATAQLLLPVPETVSFSTDGIVGTAVDPIALNAGFILVEMRDGSTIDFTIVDDTWEGAESISFIATDALTNEQLSDHDVALFSVIGDQAPLLEGIPNQSTTLGVAFSAFNLDDFLTNTDGDPVSYSFAGNTDLSVVIDGNNQVQVIKPNTDWFGEEWIVFTATDNTSNAFSDSDSVLFIGFGLDNPPSISGIPDSKTGKGGAFPPIDLNQYITELDGDEWNLSYCFSPNPNPEPQPVWDTDEGNFQFSMSIVVTVNSLGINVVGADHQLGAFVNGELRGSTNALKVGEDWMFFLLVNANSNGELIEFKFYDATDQRLLPVDQVVTFVNDSELGNPSQPITLNAGYLLVDIDEDNQARVIINDTSWLGTENVIFKIQDENTLDRLIGTDTLSFTVLDMAYPNIGDISNQTIQEGEAFVGFDLDDYLIDFPAEQVIWEVSGYQNLAVTVDQDHVVTITSIDTNWFGTETLNFVAKSSDDTLLADFAEAVFSITNVNDAPIFTSNPVETATEGIDYAYIAQVADVDGDVTVIRASVLPSWLSFQVNPDGSAILSGTPTNNTIGIHFVELEVSDPANAESTQQFNITVSEFNTAPFFTSQPIQSAEEGSEYHYVISYGDDNPGDSVYVTWEVLPVWLQLVDSANGKASLIGTPLDEHTGLQAVELKVIDRLGLTANQSFQLEVLDINNVPSTIVLSNHTIAENQESGSIVGEFSAMDADANDSFQFSLVNGNGDTDNALFLIEDNRLRAFTSFDYETQSELSIRVQVIDNSGAELEQVFTIQILDLDDPPTALNDELLAKNLILFPNPAHDRTAFSLDTPLMGELKIRVLSTSGQVIWEHHFDKKSAVIQYQFDLSTWPAGLYIFRFDLNGKQAFRKLHKP